MCGGGSCELAAEARVFDPRRLGLGRLGAGALPRLGQQRLRRSQPAAVVGLRCSQVSELLLLLLQR